MHPGMELELVMLAFMPNRSPDEVQEFTAAAGAGDLDKVRTENKTSIHTPHSEQSMHRRGLDVLNLNFSVVLPVRLSRC